MGEIQKLTKTLTTRNSIFFSNELFNGSIRPLKQNKKKIKKIAKMETVCSFELITIIKLLKCLFLCLSEG